MAIFLKATCCSIKAKSQLHFYCKSTTVPFYKFKYGPPAWFILFMVMFTLSPVLLVNGTNQDNAIPQQYSIHKYLNFGYHYFDQAYLDQTISRYRSMRDFHSLASSLIPLVIFANELAKSQNVTLHAVPNYSTAVGSYKGRGKHPTLLLDIYLTNKNAFQYSWMHYWKVSSTITETSPPLRAKQLPQIVVADALSMNFAYCDFVRTRYESPWQLAIFTSPFDLYCWITLIVFFITAGIILSHGKDVSFSLVFMLLLSSLLSDGSSGITRKLKGSVLLLVWTAACSVLSTIYLGKVTSQIIRPSLPDSMKNMGDLVKRNYSLLYPNSYWLPNSADAFEKNKNPFNTTMVTKFTASGTVPDFLEEMAYGDGQAHYGIWPSAVYVMSRASQILKKGQQSNKSVIRSSAAERKCYLGKEMLPGSNFYYAFLPPNHIEMVASYQYFFNTGIFRRFMDETISWTHSVRVQDRSKFQSPTKVVDDGFVKTVSLKMKGRIKKLFLFWGINLGISILVLVLERVGYKYLSGSYVRRFKKFEVCNNVNTVTVGFLE